MRFSDLKIFFIEFGFSYLRHRIIYQNILVSPNYIEMKRKIASLQITSNHVSNHLLLSVKSVPTSTHHGRGKCNS